MRDCKRTGDISKKKLVESAKLVHADVTLLSKSGKSIYDKNASINSKNLLEFFPPRGSVEKAEKLLKSMGLRIIAKHKISICIAAPVKEFQEIFNLKLKMKRYVPYAFSTKKRTPPAKGCGAYFEYKGGRKLPVPRQLESLVDTIRLALPVILFQNPDPPNPSYYHLKIPGDIARILSADKCHRRGITGKGVKLVMPEFGKFSHPYYSTRA